MSKLWQKNYSLDSLIESFTVGEDYLLDRLLVPADCAAGIAHATMLESIGILTAAELEDLKRELRQIATDWARGSFEVLREDEDCHTAIENRLTVRLGDAGKKIHTGRSRNDQVIAALRLYSRGFLAEFADELIELIGSLVAFAEDNKSVPMPGRTHMQIAMPSSVGLWAGAFAEELLEHLRMLPALYEMVNQSPLGSAASYGVPLPLDRELVGRLLGFARVQNNVLYVNNSRGMIEAWLLSAAEMVGLTLSRMAQDLIFFTLPEIGYFALPDALCSGSSIMPQKKNPDGLELMRAKAAGLGAAANQVRATLRALPSGYNRDVQETKAPFIRSAHLVVQCLKVMNLTIRELEVRADRLEAAFSPEIFATDAALDMVLSGTSFREAYRQIGSSLDAVAARSPADSINSRTYPGTAGNLQLNQVRSAVEQVVRTERPKWDTAQRTAASLLGDQDIRFF